MKILKFFFVSLLFTIFAAMGTYAQTDSDILNGLTGKNIGVQTGSTFETIAPNIIKEPVLSYFPSISDGLIALRAGKIDAMMCDEPVLKYFNSVSDEPVKAIISYDYSESLATAFQKNPAGEKLRDEYNVYLALKKKDGSLQELEDKWINHSDGEPEIFNYENLPDINGKLVIATEPSFAPFQYMSGNRIAGYEIELVAEFCRYAGYKPVFEIAPFEGIITGLTAGTYDIAAAGLAITEERKINVNFSEPMYISHASIAVIDDAAATGVTDPGNRLVNGFYRNFVQEDRWKMFADGALVTLLIILISVTAGTALGFGVYLLTRTGRKAAVTITNLCKRVIRAFPMVVLLMILYYVIFARSGLSSVTVSIVGFTLTFACAMHGMLISGEKAVDQGQAEAAYSLGYGNNRAFFRFILPQSAMHFLPAYEDEVVSHIKATAIVGYISVVDITKAGDIIRGRTYDAIMPLAAVSIIYALMTLIMRQIIRAIARRVDTKTRTEAEILRGLKIDSSSESVCSARTNYSKSERNRKPIMEIRNLKKQFDSSVILKAVNADINEGNVIAVIGPSGTGKSTFIRCLNLLDPPTEGQIFLDGEEVTASGYEPVKVRHKVGMVFQQFNLFNHLTVLENAIVPQMDILGRSRQEACDIAVSNLKRVGLEDRLLRYPDSLSGGQKQRAAIARTLSMNPEIILMDEPTSALDPSLVGEVAFIISELAREGHTMIIVTHEMSLVKSVANRVFFMEEGGIYEDGTLEQIFNHPQKEKTAQFVFNFRHMETQMSHNIESYMETVTRAANFCSVLGLSRACIYRVQLVIEELGLHVILPKLPDEAGIHLIFETSEKDDKLKIIMKYKMPQKDIPSELKDSDNMISNVLQYAISDIHMDEDGLTVLVVK